MPFCGTCKWAEKVDPAKIGAPERWCYGGPPTPVLEPGPRPGTLTLHARYAPVLVNTKACKAHEPLPLLAVTQATGD